MFVRKFVTNPFWVFFFFIRKRKLLDTRSQL